MDIINLVNEATLKAMPSQEEYNSMKEQIDKLRAKWRLNSHKYYENNKAKVHAKYEANKESRMAKRKEYYEENKEKEREAFNTWYQNPENKAKHLAKMKENMTCECGLQILRGNLAKHRKSAIHRKALEKNSQ